MTTDDHYHFSLAGESNALNEVYSRCVCAAQGKNNKHALSVLTPEEQAFLKLQVRLYFATEVHRICVCNIGTFVKPRAEQSDITELN